MTGILLVLALFWGTADNCSPTIITVERHVLVNDLEEVVGVEDVDVRLEYHSPAEKYIW